MAALPVRRELVSADNKRRASYEPHTMDLGNGRPTPAHRLIRTIRTRRGFGTVIHSITTFTPNRKHADKLARAWVRPTTRIKSTIQTWAGGA